MSAYNTVSVLADCPRCGQRIDVIVQFKYGDTWQHEYRLLDELRWGGNDIGDRGVARVVVDGVAEHPCPACGYDDEWRFYVYVEHDRIVEVGTATGLHDFVGAANTYIVLQQCK